MYVELETTCFGFPEASCELFWGNARILVEGSEEDSYEDVIRNMYCNLATLGVFDKVKLVPQWGSALDPDEEREAREAIEKLDGFEITPEYAASVAEEAQQAAQRAQTNLKKMAMLMQEEGLKRGLNKEERQGMTLGETLGEKPPG